MERTKYEAKQHHCENSVEIQSIELACFVLSVCNVVIVAEDWFVDPNLFRYVNKSLQRNQHKLFVLKQIFRF